MRRFPGVEVYRTPTGGVAFRVFSGLVGPTPLFIIDGSPIYNTDARRGIDWLTPEQIADVRVLKDPSETAMYGRPGSQGVIIVTTKQAVKPPSTSPPAPAPPPAPPAPPSAT